MASLSSSFEIFGNDWTVTEQRSLDHAIASNPKVDGEDSKVRWQRIASKVSGRSLKECVSRYREIRTKLQQQQQSSNQLNLNGTTSASQSNVKVTQGISVGYSPPPLPPRPITTIPVEPPHPPPVKEGKNNKKKSHAGGGARGSSRGSSDGSCGCGGGGGGGVDGGISSGERKKGAVGGGVLIDDDSGEEVFGFSSMRINQEANENAINKNVGGWWRKLEEEDPISLEPLKDLPYPPFELSFQTSGIVHYVSYIKNLKTNKNNHDIYIGLIKPAANYFDGKVLAYYIVSTANFTNPLSRDELTREDCRKLDE